MNFREFLDNESVPILTNHHDNRYKDKEFQDFYQLNIVRKDGANRRCKISESRIKDTTKNIKILMQVVDFTDIFLVEKEKKQLEAQLVQAQKLEAIGTLAGGIAHDFNNLLMAIQGRISLMQLHTHPDHPHYADINEIENTIKSASKLTKQLLGFARGGKYEVKPTCINELVDKNSQMYSRTNKEIRVHKKFQKNIWTVEVDPGQIEQVLLNLYVNACQAMPEGGDLFLQTENIILSDKYCKSFKIVPGKYVKIIVTDTGIGMDKKLIKRIFEPFFTTKKIGKGTGLGLASAYGIIKNHNGIIRVYSEKGHGSTFNIYLPASPHLIFKKMHPYSELAKGKETILLVDDEEAPIAVGKLMLEELGYEVFLAKSGEEAITFTQKNILTLDMIILDMIMPKMNGRETYDRLKEINPDIKVLLSSGYSLNLQIEEMIKRGCKGFIQKPFDINQLSQQVREVLDK